MRAYGSVKLSDVATVLNGKTPSREDQRAAGHPVLKIRDVDEAGVFRGRFDSYVDDDFAAKFPEKAVRSGDTLILNAAHNADYVGSKQFFARRDVEGALATGEWLLVRPDGVGLDGAYAHYWLTAPQTLRTMREMVKGIHLYPKDVSRLSLGFLPPLDEQRRIAAIFGKADALRQKRRRAIALLDSLAQSIFLEMFGVPGDPTTSAIPQRPLGEIAQLINGDRSSNYPSGDDIVSSGVLFLNTSNLTPEGLDLKTANYITEQKFGSLTRGKLAPGDIVITLRGSLGQTAIFENAGETGFINAQMMIIRPGDRIDTRYLLQALQLDSTLAHFKKIGSGSAVPQITGRQMSELLVPLPELNQQRKFAIRKFALARTRQIALQNLDATEGLFASLQHRAFSGQL